MTPGFATIKRLVRTVNVGAGISQTYDIDIPRDFAYLALLLFVTGTLTTAAGGGHAGTPVDLNPWTFVRRVEIEGTGGDKATTIKNLRGTDAVALEHLQMGVEPPRLAVASDAVAVYPFSCMVPIWFGLRGATLPPEITKSTIINPGQYGKINLAITLGDATDFAAGGDRAHTFSGITIDVVAIQPVNIDLGKSAPLTLRESSLFRDASAGTAQEQRFANPLAVGNRYRGLLVTTYDAATVAGIDTPIDDTLGPIRFFVGTSQIQRYQRGMQVCTENQQSNMVAPAVNVVGLTALSNGQNPRIGHHYFDWMQGGRFESLLDTRKMPSTGVGLDFIFDTLQGAATARVLQVASQEILG